MSDKPEVRLTQIARWAFAFLGLTAALTTFGMTDWTGEGGIISMVVLAMVTVLIEVKPVEVRFGADSWNFTPNEITLLSLVAAVGPHRGMIVWVAAASVAAYIQRKPRWDKMVYNAVSSCFGTALVFTIGARTPLGSHLDAIEMVLLGGALLLREVIANVAIWDILRNSGLSDGRRPDGRTMALLFASSSVTGCLGLVCLALFVANPLALVPAGILVSAFILGNRAYIAMRERMLKTERLYEFAEVFSRENEQRADASAVVERARQVLSARRSEVLLTSTDGDTDILIRLVSDAEAGIRQDLTNLNDLPRAYRQVLEDGESIRLKPDAVATDGPADSLLTAIRFDSGVAGVFVAVDRFGQTNDFSDDDLKLFETMVSHAAAWFENGQLIEQLRHEITEREHQAFHDALTDLPNRRLFQARAESAIANAIDTNSMGAVLLLDLDAFKEVNDALGHQTGDRVLQIAGDRIRTFLPQGATVARLGGDEFAVLLPSVIGPDEAQAVAMGIASELDRPIELESLSLRVEASIGIAMFPSDGTDSSLILQRADVAMYMAKSEKLGSQFYNADRDFSSARRLSLLADLRNALSRNELVLWYQPKLDLATNRIVGVESLVRWRHPVHGMVFPDDFIPLAEQSGLIGALGMQVLTMALAQQKAWRDAGLHLNVAVNLSVRNLLNLDLAADIGSLLTTYGTSPSELTIEITESAIMSDPVRARSVLDMVSSMDVKISIDDFGVGQSSLAYLRDLPVKEVKIDKCFVLTMGSENANQRDDKIARSIIDLGRNLDLQVVAEGVENRETLERLRELNCGIAQGYFIARPMPADKFDEWMATGRGHLPAVIAEPLLR